jgi:enterochelin esterase-like enzyme
MSEASPFRTIELSEPSLTEPGLRFATVKSPALRRRADATFYTPGHAGDKPLPLVLLLHGVYGSHWAWALKGAAHRVLQRLIDSGECEPMMLAMPSDGLWGDGSGYLHHADADYAKWIMEEVPALAALVEPRVLRAPLFISGLSMGGYGALRLGARFAEKFAGISAHSSITDFRQMEGFVEESMESFKLAPSEEPGVFDVMLQRRSDLPPLRFDCGTEDDLIEYNRVLHHDLQHEGIPHVYEEYPGGHTWEYWTEHVADTFRFFTSVIRTGGRLSA